MIFVCDSTVLIGLAKIGKPQLIKEVFGRIIIPEAVFAEIAGEVSIDLGLRR